MFTGSQWGGSGATAGITVILTSVLIGAAWGKTKIPLLMRSKILTTFLMSLTVHICMLLCMFLLPYPDSINVIRQIGIPVMIIYPFTSVILSLLLIGQKERRGVQDKLKQTKDMMNYIIEHDRSAVAVHDKDLRYLYVSQKYIDSYKIKDNNFIGKHHYEVFPDLPQKWRDVHQRVLKGEVVSAEDDSYERSDGTIDWTRWECRPWYENDGSIGGLIVYTEIINERKKLEIELRTTKEYLEKLISLGSAPIIVCDNELKITRFNKATEMITGKSEIDVLGDHIGQIFPDKIVSELEAAISDKGKSFSLNNDEVTINAPDGTKKILMWNYTVIYDDKHEKHLAVLLQGLDISKIKEAEKHLYYLSYHDQLTGLHNRRYFEDFLSAADIEENRPLSIIMCDVNGLKIVNDSFGHKSGDALLVKTAEVIKLVFDESKNGLAARIGGDEFVLLCPGTSAEEAKEMISQCKRLASNIEVSNVQLSISFGHDTKDNESQNIMDVLSNAENHMYRQKLYERASMRSRTIDVVMRTLFEKSARESNHSRRVSVISAAIAAELGLGKDETAQIRTAGLLHDIGKIGISENILNKNGKLDDEEWAETKKHPEIGWRILSSSAEFSELAEFVLDHHERWDGRGYPAGKKGEEIPLGSRIITLADSFDAMTSFRTYRNAMTIEEAVSEILRCSGTQFDPQVVGVFVKNVIPENKHI